MQVLINDSIEILCNKCGSILESEFIPIRVGTNDPGISVKKCERCANILIDATAESASSEVYEDYVGFFIRLYDELPLGSKISKFVRILTDTAYDRTTPDMHDCQFLINKNSK